MKSKLSLTPPILLVFAAASLASTQASAAWLDNNLREGLQMAVGATLAPSYTKTSSTFNYLYDNPNIVNYNGDIAAMLADKDRQETDERIRMSGMDSANIWVSVNKRLNRDFYISGNVLLWGSPSGALNPVYQYGLTVGHDKWGALGINTNGEFETADIATSGTYYALDAEGSAISASYTYIPNLVLSAYHAFPTSGDTRLTTDAGLHSGNGVTASYHFPFAPRHTFTVGTGYTKGERHVNLNSNTTAKEKEAAAVGIAYRYEDWKLSVDAGQVEEVFDGSVLSSVKSKNYGVRVDYEINPRASVYAAYGENNSKKDAAGQPFDFAYLANRGVNEASYFDKVERQIYRVGGSYKLYDNVTLSASAQGGKTTNYITEGKFSERENLSYTAGVSFNF